MKCAEEPAFSCRARPSFPQLSKAKEPDLYFSHLTEEGEDRLFVSSQ